MSMYETPQEGRGLFVILLGAILFVFSQLPNSIMVVSFPHAHAVAEVPTEVNHYSGQVQRTFEIETPETWRTNLAIDLPKGNDIMTADWNELECMAVNIYQESRNQSQLGQELVAQVVVNRMKMKWWPETACGVVRQAYQFSWTHDGKSDRIVDREAYERAYHIAVEYLYLKKQADLPHAEQIVNYHNHTVAPNWTNMALVETVGDHQFYRPLFLVAES
jgi:spore germination cell wall hydrolase CwlJ-like protein